jgi:hypothetical protein
MTTMASNSCSDQSSNAQQVLAGNIGRFITDPDEMHQMVLRSSQATDGLSGDASFDWPEVIGIRSGHPLCST